MTFTKETWLGMAGIAALVTYFFWPKKAAASTISTAKPATKPAAKPSVYVAPKPAATPAYTPPPYGTPGPSDATPTDSTPSSGVAEGGATPVSSDGGMGASGMEDIKSTVGHVAHGSNIPFSSQRARSLVGHVSHGSNIPTGRQLSHGMPREWWTAMPRVTGADFGMWTPPARVGSGPHVFQGKDYNPASAWTGPAPMFAQIPGFADYDLGFAYGRASCLGQAALLMRPTAPSDDWLTGYDAGCASARSRR